MQLHLEIDELNLLADVLMEQAGRTGSSGCPSDKDTRPGPQFFSPVLDKILARDLRLDTDELEQLGDILDAQRQTLTGQISRPENAARRAKLQQKLRLLDQVLERVNEACVMF